MMKRCKTVKAVELYPDFSLDFRHIYYIDNDNSNCILEDDSQRRGNTIRGNLL